MLSAWKNEIEAKKYPYIVLIASLKNDSLIFQRENCFSSITLDKFYFLIE